MTEKIVNEICSVCQCPLVVGPIYAVKDIFVCGKCDIDKCVSYKMGEFARQYLYEKYVGIETFICKNQSFGCNAEIKLEAAEHHTYTCPYRQIRCPFHYIAQYGCLPKGYTYGSFQEGYAHGFLPKATTYESLPEGCSWSGSRTELNYHVKKWHHEHIMKTPVLSHCNYHKIIFTHVKGHLFTVIILNSAPYVYKVGVFCIGTPTDLQLFKFEIKLFNKQKSDYISLRRNCVSDLFQISEHLNSQQNMVNINLENFKLFLGHVTNFRAIIGIVQKNKKEVKSLVDGSDSLLLFAEKNEKVIPLNKDLLTEIKCPVCKKIMSPPVHMCPVWRTICNSCYCKIFKTPKSLKNIRNFTLENLMNKIEYPCGNNKAGCFFTSSSDKIREHEAVCEYKKS